jgi:hypothetical protein
MSIMTPEAENLQPPQPDPEQLPQWMVNEADGDPELLDLIEQREWVIDRVSAQGGQQNFSEKDQEENTRLLHDIANHILERKKELGLIPKEDASQDE